MRTYSRSITPPPPATLHSPVRFWTEPLFSPACARTLMDGPWCNTPLIPYPFQGRNKTNHENLYYHLSALHDQIFYLSWRSVHLSWRSVHPI